MKNILIILSLLLSFSVFAKNEIMSADIKFTASGKPSFIKARGNVDLVKANIDIKENTLNASFTIDLNTLDSGISLRDTHLKEKYLEVKLHPEARVVFDKKEIDFSGDKKEIEATLD